jgi:hypothetical protein
MRQLDRKVAEGSGPLVEIGLAVVVLRMLGELFWGALSTEVVGVRVNSVMAVVRA